MEAVTSVAELREQIELSGAEVLSNYFHNSGKQLNLDGLDIQIYFGGREQLYLGGPLRHRRCRQVKSTDSVVQEI